MLPTTRMPAKKYRPYEARDIERIPQLRQLSEEERLTMRAVAAVLPFRVNNYVVEELIRWENVPDDPIYQLTFPQRDMLDPRDLRDLIDLIRSNAPAERVESAVRLIRRRLNPHPAGQMDLNVPFQKGQPLPGMQHKYRETVLFFPSQGQTCHAYCTYCFRWAQFVGDDDMKFANREATQLVEYLKEHPEVSNVLFTGGDPAIMRTRLLRSYIEPLLNPELEHLTTIRIGTKSPAYWPYRFITDRDADDLLKLFEEVRESGRHLAVMAHFTHPRELETPAAEAAVRRIVDTGAVVRCQSPVIRHVNDDPASWARMWKMQVRHGAVPYYMFVERDTGAQSYFELPLADTYRIFIEAYRQVSGLARTVRGPSMSAEPGKVIVDGITRIHGERVFALRMLQARNPDWVGHPFYARFDPAAVWFDQLRPAFGEREFFFSEELRQFGDEKRFEIHGPSTLRGRRHLPHRASGRVHGAAGQREASDRLRNSPFDS